MAQKILIDPDKFLAGPLTELNRLIESIIEEKRPYMITAKFIKVQCDNVYLDVNGQIKNININCCCFVKGQIDPGQLVQVDSRQLY